jgi:uncharacterized membrane protein YdbT with pleckstrin-like domain
LPSIILWLVALALLVTGIALERSAIGQSAGGIVALFAAYSGLKAWFRRWTTEIDVTDRRVVYKRGFIRRHTVEMNMDKIESVDVDQSLIGRLFDYGDVIIRGTGAGIEPAARHRFAARISQRRDRALTAVRYLRRRVRPRVRAWFGPGYRSARSKPQSAA